MKKLLLNNLGLVIFLPLVINFFINLFSLDTKVIDLNVYDLLSSLFLFLFLFSIGYSFKNYNYRFTITFGIITYLISFFVFESIILFFNTASSLQTNFIVINIIWLLFFGIQLKNKRLILFILSSYLVLLSFNNYFYDFLSINLNISGDVKDVFLSNVTNIYDQSYYYSIINPTMSGYPQFISYLDALIFKIAINGERYVFVSSTTFVYYWLFGLMFYELSLKKKNKLLLLFIFSILILNSQWLQFLFTTSLMSERVVIYIFSGILICLFQQKEKYIKEINLIFLLLGFVYLTKQFFSSIILILFFAFIIIYGKSSLLLLFAFLLKNLTYLSYFKGVPRDHHIRQIDFADTVLDLLLLRDLELSNFLIILKNIFIDKPVTYLLLITLLVTILYLLNTKKLSFEMNVYIFSSFLNFLLVIFLYISVWKNMELESPVRYIYNFIPLYMIIIYKFIEIAEENLSKYIQV